MTGRLPASCTNAMQHTLFSSIWSQIRTHMCFQPRLLASRDKPTHATPIPAFSTVGRVKSADFLSLLLERFLLVTIHRGGSDRRRCVLHGKSRRHGDRHGPAADG